MNRRKAFTLIELLALRLRSGTPSLVEGSGPARPAVSGGFTLIELLVVISIIAVLLALLMPAMDKAIYQAELMVCASQIKGIGGSAVTRAMDYRRKYPYRQTIHSGHFQHSQLKSDTTDDRPVMLPYIPQYGSLTCPLTGRPLDYEKATNIDVRAGYMLWFGTQIYKNGGGSYKGMLRLGDPWECQTRNVTGGAFRAFKSSVLVSDWDFQQTLGAPRALSAHPDREGRMTLVRYPNSANPDWTVARWELGGTPQRPPVDLNHAYQDLSVQRLNKLLWDDEDEDRTVSVPHRAGDTDYIGADNWKVFVPAN